MSSVENLKNKPPTLVSRLARRVTENQEGDPYIKETTGLKILYTGSGTVFAGLTHLNSYLHVLDQVPTPALVITSLAAAAWGGSQAFKNNERQIQADEKQKHTTITPTKSPDTALIRTTAVETNVEKIHRSRNILIGAAVVGAGVLIFESVRRQRRNNVKDNSQKS